MTRTATATVPWLALSILMLALSTLVARASVGIVTGPFVITTPAKPPYPADWRVRGFEGTGEVRLWVSTSGGVDSARAIPSGCREVDSALVRFGLGCSFTPRPAGEDRWSQSVCIKVPFATPRSPNLILKQHRISRSGRPMSDSAGQFRRLVAELTTAVSLDSVLGVYVYSYRLRNRWESQAKLVYFGLHPVALASTVGIENARVSAEGVDVWPGIGLCGGRRDVMIWMSNATYLGRGENASGIEPGEELGSFMLISHALPVRGWWVAGGVGACGAACYPWAADCDIDSSIRGRTYIPGTVAAARGGLVGVMHFTGPGSSAPPRVQVLGARRDTTFAPCERFMLGGLPAGAFRVRVTSPGYMPWEGWADIGSEERTLLVTMRPERP